MPRIEGDTLHLAAPDGATVRKLTKDRAPTAQASSSKWMNWNSVINELGEPYDNRRIPLAKLDKMRFDPMIAFALAFVKLPLLRAPWYIESKDARIASAVDNALRPIFPRYIMARCNDLDFGFAPLVIRYDQQNPDWTYFDQKSNTDKPVWDYKTIPMLTFKPFTGVNPRNARPHWNKDGSFGGIDYGMTSKHYSQAPDVPVELSLWATNDLDRVFGDYFGYPRTGHAYHYWWSYWYNFALSDRAFERLADPPLVGWHPVDDLMEGEMPDSTQPVENYSGIMIELLEQVRSGSSVAMPNPLLANEEGRISTIREWDIKQMEANVEFRAFMDKFEYLDVMKLRAIFVPEQGVVEGAGGTSSRNVATTHSELGMELQGQKMEEALADLNQYVIPTFLQANFGPDARARIISKGFDPKDVTTLQIVADRLMQLPENPNEPLPIDNKKLFEDLGVPVLTPAEYAQKIESEKKRTQEQTQQELTKIAAIHKASGLVPANNKAGLPAQGSVGKLPNVNPKGGFAGTTTKGLYVDDRPSITLSDNWIPDSEHYQIPEIKNATENLRNIWYEGYGDMYADFAAYVETEPLNLATDKEGFDAERLALMLTSGWSFTKKNAEGLKDRTVGIIKRAVDAAAPIMLDKAGLVTNNWSIDNPDVEEWIRTRGAVMVRNIEDTVRKQLRTFLADQLEETRDPTEVANRVRQHFKEFPGYMSQRLARTEISNAYNASTILGYKTAGVTFVQATDGLGGASGKTDTVCRERNGLIVPIDHALLIEDHPNGTLAWRPITKRFFSLEAHDGAPELRYDEKYGKLSLSNELSDDRWSELILKWAEE